MKRLYFFVYPLVAFLSFLHGHYLKAQTDRYLPTYHWFYEYAHTLQLLQPDSRWDFSNRPFLLSDFSAPLSERANPNRALERILGLHLKAYLKDFLPTASRQNLFSLSLQSDNRVGKLSLLCASGLHHTQRAALGFSWQDRLFVVTSVLLDNRLDEDPDYLGKRQNGYASYSEEAYLLYRLPHFQFLFGRSGISWGPSETGSLILSGASRPMDQLSARFRYKWLRYSVVSASLNPIGAEYRYFSGQRLDIRLMRRLWLGLSETVLYGGTYLPVHWAFHIPVIPFYGPVVNDRLGPDADPNILGALDVSYYVRAGLQVYGQLLVDDIQVEKQYPGDLEPNEWGATIGTRMAAGRFWGTLEYVRLANRTYRTLAGFTRYTHRNRPIGYPLGSDLDQLWLHGSYWFGDAFLGRLQVQYIRRGEGRLDRPFDTPWNIPGLTHYSEAFPSGVVEKTFRIRVTLRWHPLTSHGFSEVNIGYGSVKNAANVPGKRERRWFCSARCWLEFGKVWRF